MVHTYGCDATHNSLSYNHVGIEMKATNWTERVSLIILILFGLFLVYQILRYAFGGSWETESIVIALIMLNIGVSFSLVKTVATIKSDLKHLSNQFSSLAKDFKRHIEEH